MLTGWTVSTEGRELQAVPGRGVWGRIVRYWRWCRP